MKVLGRVVLSEKQVLGLVAGGQIDLEQKQFRAHAKGMARLGDMLWVQEQYIAVTTADVIAAYRKSLAMVTAPFPTDREIQSQLLEAGYRKRILIRHVPADRMPRAYSRITLEIIAFDPNACTVRCMAHMKHVGEFQSPRKLVA